MITDASAKEKTALNHQRHRLVCLIEKLSEKPMIFLGFVWLALMILDFVNGTNPALTKVSNGIWIIFILDFLFRFLLAPAKVRFLKKNWLTALSLIAPAFRILRIARGVRFLFTARAAGTFRLIRVVGSINRGMQAVRASVKRVGLPLVSSITLLVLFAGAAGMYAFEKNVPNGSIHSYSDALWWTAMMLTTSGSEYWPKTTEGRVLCFLIALYAFAVFGYIAGSLASFFVGQTSKPTPNQELVNSINELKRELLKVQQKTDTENQ